MLYEALCECSSEVSVRRGEKTILQLKGGCRENKVGAYRTTEARLFRATLFRVPASRRVHTQISNPASETCAPDVPARARRHTIICAPIAPSPTLRARRYKYHGAPRTVLPIPYAPFG